MSARPYRVWARSLISPRERFLPGLGARLANHPRLASFILRLLSAPRRGTLRAWLYRNVSRPLSRRLYATLDVPVEGGFRMLVETNDILGASLATRRLWEPHVTRLIPTLLSEGDVFADVGAHMGYYTLIGSKSVGPRGRVYALEPSSATRSLLEENVKRNGAENVRVLAVAAGAEHEDGVLHMPAAGDAARMSVQTRDSTEGEPVSIVPLSVIFERDDVERLRLVKIDVEGYEDRVLQGIEPLMARDGPRPVILLEVHAHLNPAIRAPVIEFCRRNGFASNLICDDEGFDDRFTLATTHVTWSVTLDWISTTALEHFELLLMPEEAQP